MAEIIPFRRRRKWTRSSDYGVPVRHGWLRAASESGPILIMAPLAAFVGAYMLARPDPQTAPPPAPSEVAQFVPRQNSAAELRRERWIDSPEALEAQQPNLSAPDPAQSTDGGGSRVAARFGQCSFAGRDACVIDGDTFWYQGEKIRVADINAPEVGSPGCPSEAALGARATGRLMQLLNAGPFILTGNSGRSHDKYGRTLATVSRGGESLGAKLVSEGLAEEWGGARVNWC